MICCDEDGWITTLRFAAKLLLFLGFHGAHDRLCKLKVDAILRRHPWLKTNPDLES